MDRYEILILTIPELTKDEESSLENQVEKFINAHKGSIITFDRWGKYRLSYPVRNNDYGVYFLMRFDVDNDKDFLKELQTMFYVKFNDIVMRHVVTRLKKDQPLEYKKPPSLEDVPKKRISMFEKSVMKPGASPAKKEESLEVEIEKIKLSPKESKTEVATEEVKEEAGQEIKQESTTPQALRQVPVSDEVSTDMQDEHKGEDKLDSGQADVDAKIQEPSSVGKNNQEQEV